MKPYYYTFAAWDGTILTKSETAEDAKKLAEKEAAKHPGRAIEILQCIGISQTPAPTPSTFWLDEAEKSEVETRDNIIRNLKKTLEDQERVIMNLERALERGPMPL